MYLLFLLFLISIGLSFLFSLYVVIKNSYQNGIAKSAVGIGVLLSFLIYVLLFFGVATISHHSGYSQYGRAFSLFYQNKVWFLYLSYGAFFILGALFKYKLSNHSQRYFDNIRYGYQITFVLLMVLPYKYLAILLSQMGIVKLAIVYFANINQIGVNEVGLLKDLIKPAFSHKSLIAIGLYVVVDAIMIAIPIIIEYLRNKKPNQ